MQGLWSQLHPRESPHPKPPTPCSGFPRVPWSPWFVRRGVRAVLSQPPNPPAVRRALLVALAALGLSITLALAGRTGMPGGAILSGLLLLVALGAFLAMLPFWARLRLAPMPGLFLPVRSRERWCAGCGRPAPRTAACPSCGSMPRRAKGSKGNAPRGGPLRPA